MYLEPDAEGPGAVAPGPDSLEVTVGVDGSRAARQAVVWAAYEARLRRTRLGIVHVHRTETDAPGATTDEETSRGLVVTAARAAADVEPDLDITTRVVTASSVEAGLVACSRTARMLVLGVDPTRSRASYGALGPLEDRVTVHSHCPVVTVAPYAFVAPGARPYVTIGWSDGYASRLALAAAAEEAVLRDLTLNIVTAPPEVDPQVAAVIGHHSQEPAFIAAIAALESAHPGLVIDSKHTSADVVAKLAELAADSELLVLGAHHSKRPWDTRVGPVAQALLRNGHCPVMLVGRTPAVRTPAPAARSEEDRPSGR
jgi:nucleotide-binding universal stress UspA family protein